MNAVCEYFDAGAGFWRDIYQATDVFSVIHQERRAYILSTIDRLALPPHPAVLEIGCGAGATSVALAQRGFSVQATDVAPAMLALTRKLAADSGLDRLIETRNCDVHRLPMPANSFDLVLAIGVLPWVPAFEAPMREMARVLKPGGHLIVTLDNRLRLNHLLHPFAWARALGLAIPDRLAFWRRRRDPEAKMYSAREFEARLPGYGLKKISAKTLGFGPFWGLSRILPASAGVRLHRRLQALADAGFPLLRSAGAQYIAVLNRVARAGSNSE